MYIRLAFSVAAHLESEILIVDEVLAVGDTAFQSKCLGKMSEISQTGRIVIFVSHQLGSVARLCSRAILLRAGKMVDDGRPSGVVAKYIEYSSENQEEKGYRNLRNVAHRRGNGDVRFVSARAVNMDGQTASFFAYGEPFFLQLELESTKRVEQLLVGFAVVASDGTVVQGTESPDGHSDFGVDVGPSLAQCLIAPNVLIPGKYRINIGAVVAMGNVESDWIENALAFEILTTSHNQESRLPKNMAGYVYVPYKWTLKQGSGEAKQEAVLHQAQE